MDIRGLVQIFLIVNFSLNQPLRIFLLYVRQSWMAQLILAISGNFSPLIQKDSTTHIHIFAVYVKEGLPFAWDLSLETLQILMFSTDFNSLSILLLFPLLITYFVVMLGF